MSLDDYFDLLEEQHNHDVILSPSRIEVIIEDSK